MKTFYVYILTNRSGTLFVGMTSDLIGRMCQHRNRVHDGFTSRYHVDRLVFVEEHARADDAIAREKQIKRWGREKKIALIESKNPTWRDLSTGLNQHALRNQDSPTV